MADSALFTWCHRHAKQRTATDIQVLPGHDWDNAIPSGVEGHQVCQVVTHEVPAPYVDSKNELSMSIVVVSVPTLPSAVLEETN
jgi:hypothetical protein